MTTRFDERKASLRNAFDIFPNQWIGRVPIYGIGASNLFDDARITQFDRNIGGFAGKKVIELGPLEGGHTYCMCALGATEIISIEANQDAFLRCLVVKEAFDLRVRFLCGDFEKYLLDSPPRVDVILASGILYHMRNPLTLVESMCATADHICVWTHVFDNDLIRGNLAIREKFGEPEVVEFHGRSVVWSRQSYKNDLDRVDFAGGTNSFSYWLSLEGFVDAFDALGFDLNILDRHEGHPHGPCATFVAKRRSGR